MDNIDIIERYLTGQLNAEEEKAFREQLKNDKAFRDEVLATALMIKQMKQQNQEKEKAILAESIKIALEKPAARIADPARVKAGVEAERAEAARAALEEAQRAEAERRAAAEEMPPAASIPSVAAKPAASKTWIYWVSSIAALFIIAFIAVKPIYFNYKSDQMISQNYAQWSPREEGTTKGASRGEVHAGENVIAELTELFDNVGKGKDMKMTTYRLEKALKESETDYEYYQYTADIVWYLALAYIQENQFGKARTALSAIIESEDPYYLERAEKLYKEIENMYFM